MMNIGLSSGSRAGGTATGTSVFLAIPIFPDMTRWVFAAPLVLDLLPRSTHHVLMVHGARANWGSRETARTFAQAAEPLSTAIQLAPGAPTFA